MSSFTKGWRPIASIPTRATYRLRASHISMYRDLRKERSRRRTLTGHSQVSRPSRRCIGQFGSIQVSTRCTSAHVPQHPCQRVTGWRMGRDWPMPAVTGDRTKRDASTPEHYSAQNEPILSNCQNSCGAQNQKTATTAHHSKINKMACVASSSLLPYLPTHPSVDPSARIAFIGFPPLPLLK